MKRGTLHVNRIKNGIASVHPVGGEKLRALRKINRDEPEGRYLFVSERGASLSQEGFLKMVKRAGYAGGDFSLSMVHTAFSWTFQGFLVRLKSV